MNRLFNLLGLFFTFGLFASNLNICHIDFIGNFLVHKDISISELDTILEQFQLNIENRGQVSKSLVPVDVLREIGSFFVVNK